MIKNIYLSILFLGILTGCRFKEWKLPADVDFTNTILFTAQIDDKYALLRPQIFAVKVDSPHTLYQLTDTRYPLESPIWLPDGSGILFLWTRFDSYSNKNLSKFIGQGHVGWADPADVYIMDTTGIRGIIICWENMAESEREKYKELEGTIFSVAPTAYGKIIYNLGGYKFIVHDTTQSKIAFIMIKIPTKELAHVYGNFSVSPSGKEIAFATQLEEDPKKVSYSTMDSISPESSKTSFNEIFVISIKDGKYKRLTYNNFADDSPCWSQDGKKIYFSRYIERSIKADSEDFQSDIFVMDSDGKNRKNLTNTPQISESSPKISPDDKLIAYIVKLMEHDRYTEIRVMNNDGTNKRKVIGFHAYTCGEISWYPRK